MSHDSDRAGRRPGPWVYLGASGVLQPLSEEFLYRSPEDAARHACRWRTRPLQAKTRAAR